MSAFNYLEISMFLMYVVSCLVTWVATERRSKALTEYYQQLNEWGNKLKAWHDELTRATNEAQTRQAAFVKHLEKAGVLIPEQQHPTQH